VLAAALLAPAAAQAGRGADGKFEQRDSPHFVLYQDVAIDEVGGLRGSRRFEQEVLDELERSHGQLDVLLGLRPERKLVVVVYDQTVFDTGFAPRFGFRPAGFYDGSIHVRASDRLTLQLARVLRHELVHAAFAAAMPTLILPGWLNEGVAEWFEARALSKRRLSPGELGYLAQARAAGALLPLAALNSPAFGGFGEEQATLAYLQSYGMIEYLARRHGDASVREFCRELVRTRDLERSMRRTFRFGVGELEARFTAELG
jgi:hypothetical protein